MLRHICLRHVVFAPNFDAIRNHLTHDVLYKNCTDADVTIVTTHNFKNNEIAVSIRSRVNCVSAVQLIRSLPMESPQHGDGNDKAAGGRIPMTHKLNELF